MAILRSEYYDAVAGYFGTGEDFQDAPKPSPDTGGTKGTEGTSTHKGPNAKGGRWGVRAAALSARMLWFLRLMSEGYSVSSSCKGAGINRRFAYHIRERVPEFARCWDESADMRGDWYEDRLRDQSQGGSYVATIVGLKMTGRYSERHEVKHSGVVTHLTWPQLVELASRHRESLPSATPAQPQIIEGGASIERGRGGTPAI